LKCILNTYCAASFKYIDEGVRNSAESVALRGMRFGGFACRAAVDRTSRTVARDGCMERVIFEGEDL
jgi:hypothetical protein